ncbi:hypothetical protein B6U98_01695 [Thermoplasmatales archaeon ex4572_165]|nr:MAG: hypothetical protein B6U98_01695 [Thermoplasmatales archaeon ex4572_165]RLF57636.1 MAG: hypothetical protein DRN27_07415 [Thermoplasmata archaeon]
MGKKKVLFIINLFLIISLFHGCISQEIKENHVSQIKIFYVDINGFENYTSIQDAINDASDNSTIHVSNGTYQEQIIIDKKIHLIGSDPKKTIIDADFTDDAIIIKADHTIIEKFTITHSGKIGYPYYNSALYITSNDTTIKNNIITNNTNGIYTYRSSNNIFENNSILSTTDYGLYIEVSSNNSIKNNKFSLNNYCLKIKNSINCTIIQNQFFNSIHGMYFCCGSKHNMVYHNTFVNNSKWHCDDQVGDNYWCNEIIKRGNYWDDYTGIDQNGDGIGDSFYNISKIGKPDYYPLINKI